MEVKSANIPSSLEVLQRQGCLLDLIAGARRRRNLSSEYRTQIRDFLEDETFDLNYLISGTSPLSEAATYPSDSVLTMLLESGRINVDLHDDEGRTALSYAAECQGASCVEALLLHGANHAFRDNCGRCPLSWASTSGTWRGDYKAVADLLVARGADVNSEDKNGATPLTLAVIEGLEEIVSHLLSFDRVDVNCQDVQGRSPLSHAAEDGLRDIAQLLVKSGANINSTDASGRTPLTLATLGGHKKIVSDLLARNSVNVDHPDLDNRTSLSYAAALCYVDMARFLLESGANINSEDIRKRTPLIWATIQGGYKVVDFLLSFKDVNIKNPLSFKGVNIDHRDIDNRTSLSHAAEAGSEDIMKLLMKSGANGMHVNNDGRNCFWLLLRNRRCPPQKPSNPSRLCFLVASLSDPDFRDLEGRTLLSWAAEYGDDAMVRALLQNGADPNLQDDKGSTRSTYIFCKSPIIWALEKKQWSTVQVLNKKDTNSLHLLHKESHIIGEKEALELVQALVDSKYNIEQVDAEGKRPLHLASNMPNAGFARALISAEPALNSRDNSSKTPLQYAFMKANEGVIQVLIENGADIGPIDSECWLNLRAEPRLYVELNRQGTRQSYVFKQTAVQNGPDWVPCAGKYKLWYV